MESLFKRHIRAVRIMAIAVIFAFLANEMSFASGIAVQESDTSKLMPLSLFDTLEDAGSSGSDSDTLIKELEDLGLAENFKERAALAYSMRYMGRLISLYDGIMSAGCLEDVLKLHVPEKQLSRFDWGAAEKKGNVFSVPFDAGGPCAGYSLIYEARGRGEVKIAVEGGGERKTRAEKIDVLAGSTSPTALSVDEAYELIRGTGLSEPLESLDAALRFARGIERYPIDKVVIVGAGLRELPVLLSLMGKEVIFVDMDTVMRDSVARRHTLIMKKLAARGISPVKPVRYIEAEIGELDLEDHGISPASFDLITFAELIGPEPKGDPGKWFRKAGELLKSRGYILIDEHDMGHSRVLETFREVFPLHEKAAGGKKFTGEYNGPESDNRLYRVRNLPEEEKTEPPAPHGIGRKTFMPGLASVGLAAIFIGGFDPMFFLVYPIAIYALTFHEYAHGRAAYHYGDDTAFRKGRLSLSPWDHISLIGTFIMPLLFGIGWAKPVPVDFTRLTRKQQFYVAAAGPATNFALAGISGLLHFSLAAFIPPIAETLLIISYFVNLILGTFNLLPIGPLDGSRMIEASLGSARARARYQKFQKYFVRVILVGVGSFWAYRIGGTLVNAFPAIYDLLSLSGLSFLGGTLTTRRGTGTGTVSPATFYGVKALAYPAALNYPEDRRKEHVSRTLKEMFELLEEVSEEVTGPQKPVILLDIGDERTVIYGRRERPVFYMPATGRYLQADLDKNERFSSLYRTLFDLLKGDEAELILPFNYDPSPKSDIEWDLWQTDMDWNFMGKNNPYPKEIDPIIIKSVSGAMKEFGMGRSGAEVVMLDIFGGAGRMIAALDKTLADEYGRARRAKPATRYFLIDRNDKNIERAGEKLKDINVTILKRDMSEVTDIAREIGARPDIVTCEGGLTYQIVSREQALKIAERVYEALAPGGVFILTGYTPSLLEAADFSKMGFKVINKSMPSGILDRERAAQLYILIKERTASGIGDKDAAAAVPALELLETGRPDSMTEAEKDAFASSSDESKDQKTHAYKKIAMLFVLSGITISAALAIWVWALSGPPVYGLGAALPFVTIGMALSSPSSSGSRDLRSARKRTKARKRSDGRESKWDVFERFVAELDQLPDAVIEQAESATSVGNKRKILLDAGAEEAGEVDAKYLISAISKIFTARGLEKARERSIWTGRLQYGGHGRYLCCFEDQREHAKLVVKIPISEEKLRNADLYSLNGARTALERLGGGLAADTMIIDARQSGKSLVFQVDPGRRVEARVAVVQEKLLPLIDHLKRLARKGCSEEELKEAFEHMERFKELIAAMYKRGIVDSDKFDILGNYGIRTSDGSIAILDLGEVSDSQYDAGVFLEKLDDYNEQLAETLEERDGVMLDPRVSEYYLNNPLNVKDFVKDGKDLFGSEYDPEGSKMIFPYTIEEVRQYFGGQKLESRGRQAGKGGAAITEMLLVTFSAVLIAATAVGALALSGAGFDLSFLQTFAPFSLVFGAMLGTSALSRRKFFDLDAVEAGFEGVKNNFEKINIQLRTLREDLDGVTIKNMLLGYRFLNRILDRGRDMIPSELLEINKIVLYGHDIGLRYEYSEEIDRAEDQFARHIGSFWKAYKGKEGVPAWEKAAAMYGRLLSQPLLFADGTQRTAVLMAGFILVRAGLPPLVLNIDNAVEYFEISSGIKISDKRGSAHLERFLQGKWRRTRQEFEAFLKRSGKEAYLTDDILSAEERALEEAEKEIWQAWKNRKPLPVEIKGIERYGLTGDPSGFRVSYKGLKGFIHKKDTAVDFYAPMEDLNVFVGIKAEVPIIYPGDRKKGKQPRFSLFDPGAGKRDLRVSEDEESGEKINRGKSRVPKKQKKRSKVNRLSRQVARQKTEEQLAAMEARLTLEQRPHERDLPDGSPLNVFRILREEKTFLFPEDVRRRTKGKMPDGHLSVETVKRDLGTLFQLGLVEKFGMGGDSVYIALELSLEDRHVAEKVLAGLGARPSAAEKRSARKRIAAMSPLNDEFDIRPSEAGLLHPVYISDDMTIKAIVNPDSLPLTAVYGAAGTDISNFLLSTDATEGYFISHNEDLQVFEAPDIDAYRALEDPNAADYISEFDEMTYKHKFNQGFSTAWNIISADEKILALALELEAIGASDVKVDLHEGSPRIRFNWAYYGGQQKEREITFIEADMTEPASYPELLRKVFEKGVDIYYQRAALRMPKTYINENNYIKYIHTHLTSGGFFVTDDNSFREDGPNSRENYTARAKDFPIKLEEISVPGRSSRTGIISDLRRGRASKSYGWELAVRQKEKAPVLFAPDADKIKRLDREHDHRIRKEEKEALIITRPGGRDWEKEPPRTSDEWMEYLTAKQHMEIYGRVKDDVLAREAFDRQIKDVTSFNDIVLDGRMDPANEQEAGMFSYSLSFLLQTDPERMEAIGEFVRKKLEEERKTEEGTRGDGLTLEEQFRRDDENPLLGGLDRTGAVSGYSESPTLHDLLREHFRDKDSIKGYDLGSSVGWITEDLQLILKEMFGEVDFTGIEKDRLAVEAAKEEGTPVVYGDARELADTLAFGKADLITMTNPDPRTLADLVKAAKKMVSPDGLILVDLATQDMDSLMKGEKVYGVEAAAIRAALSGFNMIELDPEDQAWEMYSEQYPYLYENLSLQPFLFVYSPAFGVNDRTFLRNGKEVLIEQMVLRVREECGPIGACKLHALDLARRMTDLGMDARVVKHDEHVHYWVESDGLVIDPFPEGMLEEYISAAGSLGDERFIISPKDDPLVMLLYQGTEDVNLTREAIDNKDGDLAFYIKKKELVSRLLRERLLLLADRGFEEKKIYEDEKVIELKAMLSETAERLARSQDTARSKVEGTVSLHDKPFIGSGLQEDHDASSKQEVLSQELVNKEDTKGGPDPSNGEIAQEFVDAMIKWIEARAVETGIRGENLVIGIDTSWIPEEQLAMSGMRMLLKRIEALSKSKIKGFQGVKVCIADDPGVLAKQVLGSRKTGVIDAPLTPLSNIVLIGEEEVLSADMFRSFKGSEDEAGAFFAKVVLPDGMTEETDVDLIFLASEVLRKVSGMKNGRELYVRLPDAGRFPLHELAEIYKARSEALIRA
jgi:Zn-dependent protease/ubiquinone/menaquinone biosynthesis C-methylase UbiE